MLPTSLWFLLSLLLQVLLIDDVADAFGARGRCPNPRPYFRNGIPKLRHRGRVVKYVCFPGFTLVGNDIATCYSGRWDRPIPFCAAPGCTLPSVSAFRYGTIVNVNNANLVLQFRCRAGYLLSGAQTTYCDGRTWNATIPRCTPMELNPSNACDFENPDICSWTIDLERQIQFRRNYVQKDHTYGGAGTQIGHVMSLVNGTGVLNPKQIGRMVSPVFRSIDTPGCFSLWYRLPCTGCELRLLLWQEADAKLLWSVKGPDNTDWVQAQVAVPTLFQDFQFVIEGTPGNSLDIAVDDVALHPKSQECLPTATDGLVVDDGDFTTEGTSGTESTFETTPAMVTTTTTSPSVASVSTRAAPISVYTTEPPKTTTPSSTASSPPATTITVVTQTTAPSTTKVHPIFIISPTEAHVTLPPSTTTRLTTKVSTVSRKETATTVMTTAAPTSPLHFVYTTRPVTSKQSTIASTVRRRLISTTRSIAATETRRTVKPTTKMVTTVRPIAEMVTTVRPIAEMVTTVRPIAEMVTTVRPTTKMVTTVRPTTKVITTVRPTTKITKMVTTLIPTTNMVTTLIPTTKMITTIRPTTKTVTTVRPTTKITTTARPTTKITTTVKPTAQFTTRVRPTTKITSTARPTTKRSTTAKPTTSTTQATTMKMILHVPTKVPESTSRKPIFLLPNPERRTSTTTKPISTTSVVTRRPRLRPWTTTSTRRLPTTVTSPAFTRRPGLRPRTTRFTTVPPTTKATIHTPYSPRRPQYTTFTTIRPTYPTKTTTSAIVNATTIRQRFTPTRGTTTARPAAVITTSTSKKSLSTTVGTDIPNELHPLHDYTAEKQGRPAGLKSTGKQSSSVVGAVAGGLVAIALLLALGVLAAYKLRARARQRRMDESEMTPLSKYEEVDPSVGQE